METNRYFLRPQRSDGTWSVVDSATGEIAKVSGVLLERLAKKVAMRLVATLNANHRSSRPPLPEE
jgi:hypothetical protein